MTTGRSRLGGPGKLMAMQRRLRSVGTLTSPRSTSARPTRTPCQDPYSGGNPRRRRRNSKGNRSHHGRCRARRRRATALTVRRARRLASRTWRPRRFRSLRLRLREEIVCPRPRLLAVRAHGLDSSPSSPRHAGQGYEPPSGDANGIASEQYLPLFGIAEDPVEDGLGFGV